MHRSYHLPTVQIWSEIVTKKLGQILLKVNMPICFAIIRDELTQQRDNLQLELAEIKVKVSRTQETNTIQYALLL
jgi:hypothetical protein